MSNLKVFPELLAYAAICILFILIGKWLYDLWTPYKLDDELTQKDNPAIGIALFGYFIALIIIIAGVIPHAEKVSFQEGLLEVTIYGVIGIILLNISRLITDKLILHKFKINKELIDDKNIGTGAVLFGSYVASGMVIIGCLAGDMTGAAAAKAFGDGFSAFIADTFGKTSVSLIAGILLSLIFFVIGQLTFILYSFIYSWVLPYNPHEEIERDNAAAGIAFSGGLIALGLILYRAIQGDGKFTGWMDSLTYYVSLTVFAIIVFPLVRIFVDRIMLSKANLKDEIVRDRNVNAAFLEIICLNAVSAVVIFAY